MQRCEVECVCPNILLLTCRPPFVQENGASFEGSMFKLLRTLPRVPKFLPSDKAAVRYCIPCAPDSLLLSALWNMTYMVKSVTMQPDMEVTARVLIQFAIYLHTGIIFMDRCHKLLQFLVLFAATM